MPRHEDSWKQVPRSVWRRMKESHLPHTSSIDHLPDNKWSIRFHAAESMHERESVVEEALERMSVEEFANLIGLSPQLIREHYLTPVEVIPVDRQGEEDRIFKEKVIELIKERGPELLKQDPPLTLVTITNHLNAEMQERFGRILYHSSSHMKKVLRRLFPDLTMDHEKRYWEEKEEVSEGVRKKREQLNSMLKRLKALISRDPNTIQEVERLLDQLEGVYDE